MGKRYIAAVFGLSIAFGAACDFLTEPRLPRGNPEETQGPNGQMNGPGPATTTTAPTTGPTMTSPATGPLMTAPTPTQTVTSTVTATPTPTLTASVSTSTVTAPGPSGTASGPSCLTQPVAACPTSVCRPAAVTCHDKKRNCRYQKVVACMEPGMAGPPAVICGVDATSGDPCISMEALRPPGATDCSQADMAALMQTAATLSPCP